MHGTICHAWNHLPCTEPFAHAPNPAALQISKGKCEGLQALSASLLQQVSEVCPEEAAEYKWVGVAWAGRHTFHHMGPGDLVTNRGY